MNSYVRRNINSNWFSPCNNWELLDSCVLIEESSTVTEESYNWNFIVKSPLQPDVETKIDGQYITLKLYRKKNLITTVPRTKENAYELFFFRNRALLPDMIKDEIATIFKDHLITIKIPRQHGWNTNRNTPKVNFYKESYYG